MILKKIINKETKKLFVMDALEGNSGFSRKDTPKLIDADEYARFIYESGLEQDLLNNHTEEIEKATTVPSLPALTTLLQEQTRKKSTDQTLLESTELTKRVSAQLNPLIVNGRPSQDIYNALCDILDNTPYLEDKRKIWDIAVAILKSFIKTQIREIFHKPVDENKFEEIKKLFGLSFCKIISPFVRITLIKEILDGMNNSNTKDIQKKHITQIFIMSLANYCIDINLDFQNLASSTAIKAFQTSKIPQPKKDDINLDSFIKPYPSEDNNLYSFFVIKEAEGSKQSAAVLDLIRRTQHLGLIPKELDGFDRDSFVEYCKAVFVELVKIIKEEKDKNTQIEMYKVWNKILAPQLIIIGEMVLANSNFLLPALK